MPYSMMPRDHAGLGMRDVTAFSVPDIIRTSFAVYFSNLPTFLPLSLVVLLPSFAVVLFVGSSSLNDPLVMPALNEIQDPAVAYAALGRIYLVLTREFFVNWLCAFWLQAALAFGVVRHLRGGHADFAEQIAQAVRRMVPATAVAAIVAVATGIGLYLLVVPGVILAMVLWVAVPAVIVERRGLHSLARSAELTRGFRGQIFGLALVLTLLHLVAGTTVVLVSIEITTNPLLVWSMGQAVGVVFVGIWATAASVSYHDLRVLREGVDTRSVSRVDD